MISLPFQEIYDTIAPLLPEEWDKVILYAEYAEDSFEMKFWVKNKNEFIDCFALPTVSEKEVLGAFMDIDELIAPSRNTLNGDDIWTVLTIVISNDGQFHADYSYEDLSENKIEFIAEWKKKYLV